MPQGQRTLLIQRVRELLRTEDRFVDVAARLRVWRRDPATGLAVPDRLLHTVYGGRYDSVLRRIVGPATAPVELSCHEGQLEFLEHSGVGGVRRVLALGPPGGGKTYAAVLKAYLLGLAGNRTIGVVVPTTGRGGTAWQYIVEIGERHGWLAWVRETRREIGLVNGTVFNVLSGVRQSSRRGTTVQGRNWDAAVEDESQNIEDYVQTEIDFRGRLRADYCVYETATNDPIAEFRQRKRRYLADPAYHKIIRFGTRSPWVREGFYDEQKHSMTERDWLERIALEDQESETRTYYKYDPKATIRERVGGLDITAKVIAERYPDRDLRQNPAEILIAQDFGHTFNTSVLLRCFAGPSGPEWWAVAEYLTRRKTAREHAEGLKQAGLGITTSNSIVIADPHPRQAGDAKVDLADYRQFREAGFDIRRASSTRISRKHRVAMVNTLLCDATGTRHLFLEADKYGRPRCPELATAFEYQDNDANGEPEMQRKDEKDPSHPTATVGYGLYPFERWRGGLSVVGPGAERGAA